MQPYQNYLSAPGHLTFPEMNKIHEDILEQRMCHNVIF